MYQLQGWKSQHNHQLKNQHTRKHHIDCALAPNNRVTHNIRYINPLRHHTRSTALVQLLIQEYDHHIAHLYHQVTGAK